MASERIDRNNLILTGAHEAIAEDAPHLLVEEGVLIIVTQAFGPDGDNLIEASQESFDGYPGIPVLVETADRSELVHLSPFHGDARKVGMEGLPAGTKCTLCCPVSKKPLDQVGSVGKGSDAVYHAIYLTPRLSEGEVVLISDVWDDYKSKLIDNFELISTWEVD